MIEPDDDHRHLSEFLAWQQRRNFSPNTMRHYRDTLRGYIGSLHGKPLADATAEDVEHFLAGRNITARGRYHYLSNIGVFYRWLIEEGHAATNPTKRIPRPKVPVNKPRPIRDDDLVLALKTPDVRMRAWLLLGAYQGMRCQEIAGLRREDVLDHEDPPMLIVSKPKGNRERVLPLHPEVMAALRVYGLPRDGYVFRHWQEARPVQPETVSHNIARYFRDIGIGATAHQLRHWFGTRLYAKTRDLRLTQEMLGHASPDMTAVYVAFSPGDAVDAVTALEVHREAEGVSTVDHALPARPELVVLPGGRDTDAEVDGLISPALCEETDRVVAELIELLPRIAKVMAAAGDVITRSETAMPEHVWDLDSDLWERIQAAYPIGRLRELLRLVEGLSAEAVREAPTWSAFDELRARYADVVDGA